MSSTADRTVISQQGDTVDLIAARHYDGDTAMTVAILEANPGLAAHGPILPHGTTVVLPPRKTKTKKKIALW